MSKENRRKPYDRPTATRLTPDEAKAKLLEHARKGDQEAMHFLESVFPEEARKLSQERKRSA